MIKTFKNIILFVLFPICGFTQDIYFPDSIRVFDEICILAKKDINQSGVKIIKIDSLIIENKILSDLSTLLSENSPVFIKSYGKGSLSTASFRGTNASHTKVSWNNVSLNSPMLGMVDMSQIPVAIADNIILYHGSASLSKNSNAIGGLIELNTLPVWKKGFRGEFASSVGSFSTYDNQLKLNIGNKTIQSVTKIYKSSSDNNFPFYNYDITNSSIEFRQNADYTKKGFVQELFFRTSEKSILSFKGWYQQSSRGVPGLTTNEVGINSIINRQNGDHVVYSAEYTWYGNKSKIEFTHGGNYQNFDYKSENYINGLGYLKVVAATSRSFSTYNSLSNKYKITDKTEITGRLNYNYHNVNSLEQIYNETYDTTRQEGGIILSLFTGEIKDFRLGVLLRQDFYDLKLSPFIPSVFAEYYLNQNFIIKASCARNYNLPGLNDLYFSPGGNPDLKPEKGYSIDGGIQNLIKKDRIAIQSEISINYSSITDWIMWRPTSMGYWTPANVDKVTAYGADCNLNLKYLISDFYFSHNANYAYTKSQNKTQSDINNDNSAGKQLPYIPLHSANVFSRVEYHKFYISYQWNYYSERHTSSAAEPGVLVSIYPYFMNDMAVGKIFEMKNFKLDLNIRVFNIFNESYRSILWQPMPGRNYGVQLLIKFK